MLADLHDDLPARVERQRLLWRWESDYFGNGGNLISTVLLAQCLVENMLAADVSLDAHSAEIHQRSHETLRDRPVLRETVAACRRLGMLGDIDKRDLLRLAEAHNALAHFRPVSDGTDLDRRVIDGHLPAALVCYEDARFGMCFVVRILGKPAFLYDRSKPGDDKSD